MYVYIYIHIHIHTAFFTVTGLELTHRKSRITISFQEFACEDCDLLSVICGKYFSFHEYSAIY